MRVCAPLEVAMDTPRSGADPLDSKVRLVPRGELEVWMVCFDDVRCTSHTAPLPDLEHGWHVVGLAHEKKRVCRHNLLVDEVKAFVQPILQRPLAECSRQYERDNVRHGSRVVEELHRHAGVGSERWIADRCDGPSTFHATFEEIRLDDAGALGVDIDSKAAGRHQPEESSCARARLEHLV